MTSNQTPDNIFENNVFSTVGEKFYLEPEKADVFFLFKSGGERVPAHKIILANGSDVFDKMFFGPMKEEGDILIVDASADSFKQFLRFFYFNRIEFEMLTDLEEMMYLAKKYNVEECLRACLSFMRSKLSTDNAISFLELAIQYDETELQQLCELKISENSKDVLQSTGFKKCDRSTLSKVLRMEVLSCDASEVLEACLSWIKDKSDQQNVTRDILRTHLGDLFYEIPFCTMSMEEFVRMCSTEDQYCDLFTVNEYNDIIGSILTQKPGKFFNNRNTMPICEGGPIVTMNRNISTIDDAYLIDTIEITIFSTNKPIFLRHFLICPITDDYGSYPNVNISIICDKFVLVSDFKVNADDLKYAYGAMVTLQKPIFIRPHQKHEIRISLPSGRFHTWRILRESIDLCDSDLVVQFHNCPMLNDSIRGTVIELGFYMPKRKTP